MHLLAEKRPQRKAEERRSNKRKSARIDVRFFAENLFYSGAVLDLSENGMFINTNKYLPGNTLAVILFQSANEEMQVVVRVRYSKRNNGYPHGMGVEISAPPLEYIEYIKKA